MEVLHERLHGQSINCGPDRGTTEFQSIPDEVYEKVLSGVGLGDYMIYKMIPAGADPLGPDNVLGFTSGLLTGTGAFMNGRWMAVCKSPLTGGIGEANCGGQFAPAIKQCGVDAIFFKGVADGPVYLHVDNKGAEIRDASHVWGKDASEAESILTEECTVKKTPRVALIGQAGENMSLISGITNDYGRIAARSGVGAVMGSKKLKAVVLAGSKQIKCHDRAEVSRLSKGFADFVNGFDFPTWTPISVFKLMGANNRRAMLRNKDTYHEHDGANFYMAALKGFGTSGGYEMMLAVNDAPVKNWSESYKALSARKARNIGGAVVHKNEYQKYHCYSCAVGCGGLCHAKKETGGKYNHTHKPEYETQALLGSMCLNGDYDAFIHMNELCNRAGIDTIAVGGTIAFAMECYQNGILTDADFGGMTLNWGEAKTSLKLLEMMIHREGIGDILADGPKLAAERIGRGAEAYAITAGGQPPAAHDSRFNPLLAIQYCADPTPGKHTSAAHHYNELFLWDKVESAPRIREHLKTEQFVASEEWSTMSAYASAAKQLCDGTGGCVMALEFGVNAYPIFEYMNAATGWDLTGDEYITIGRRMETLRQMFNIKHGINPKDNFLHKRMLTALKDGGTKGRALDDIDQMVAYHWKVLGWDEETGIPLEATKDSLGLLELENAEVTA